MLETVLSKRRKRLKESRRQRALKMLDAASLVLYKDGASAVYVFGSLLRPLEFNEQSDVDIAVKGIDEDKWSSVFVKLEHIFKDMPFELIFLEDHIRPEIRMKIEKEGALWKR
jgi:predicted nucleotidyltransferase